VVGDQGGAKEFRKSFLVLSGNHHTSIEFWQSLSLIELRAWSEAATEEVENNG